MALAPGIATLFFASAKGFIKQYSPEEFPVEDSVQVNGSLTSLMLDPKRKVLYALAARPGTDAHTYLPRKLPVVDIVAFALGGAAGSPVK